MSLPARPPQGEPGSSPGIRRAQPPSPVEIVEPAPLPPLATRRRWCKEASGGGDGPRGDSSCRHLSHGLVAPLKAGRKIRRPWNIAQPGWASEAGLDQVLAELERTSGRPRRVLEGWRARRPPYVARGSSGRARRRLPRPAPSRDGRQAAELPPRQGPPDGIQRRLDSRPTTNAPKDRPLSPRLDDRPDDEHGDQRGAEEPREPFHPWLTSPDTRPVVNDPKA
jgi:hypothetical protein